MKIHLQEIPQGHSSLSRKEPAQALDLEDWFHPRETVEVHLEIDRRGEELTLRGWGELEAEAECGRCAVTFPFAVRAELVALADRRGSDDPRDEAALEQEGAVLYHDGLTLDLTDSLREAIILETPQALICRDDCRGICPKCGTDLNESKCSCRTDETDPRWEALKDLAQDDR